MNKFSIVRVAQVLAAAATGQLNKESSVDTVIQRNADCHRDSAPGMKLNVSAAVAQRIAHLAGSANANPVPTVAPVIPETNPATSEPIADIPETPKAAATPAAEAATDDAADDPEA
ncbi:hypothetical protein [Aureliella helgolandensis]|uniref:Uncharacterized protein n=1 Tax=Aureliella helgolandensis TaxID=2527968 RepID=A0A518G4R3_9BACT|nr:hypothetical protein [Aureliella helgolandensis]QDV23585.1 hypothetical protein Q31a_18870 [Aureliella helgolandensis]